MIDMLLCPPLTNEPRKNLSISQCSSNVPVVHSVDLLFETILCLIINNAYLLHVLFTCSCTAWSTLAAVLILYVGFTNHCILRQTGAWCYTLAIQIALWFVRIWVLDNLEWEWVLLSSLYSLGLSCLWSSVLNTYCLCIAHVSSCCHAWLAAMCDSCYWPLYTRG